jgi:hypothetical protein
LREAILQRLLHPELAARDYTVVRYAEFGFVWWSTFFAILYIYICSPSVSTFLREVRRCYSLIFWYEMIKRYGVRELSIGLWFQSPLSVSQARIHNRAKGLESSSAYEPGDSILLNHFTNRSTSRSTRLLECLIFSLVFALSLHHGQVLLLYRARPRRMGHEASRLLYRVCPIGRSPYQPLPQRLTRDVLQHPQPQSLRLRRCHRVRDRDRLSHP